DGALDVPCESSPSSRMHHIQDWPRLPVSCRRLLVESGDHASPCDRAAQGCGKARCASGAQDLPGGLLTSDEASNVGHFLETGAGGGEPGGERVGEAGAFRAVPPDRTDDDLVGLCG